MSVEAGLERDLKRLPEDLREGALAQAALAVAQSMDNFETEPAEMASCLRALSVALDRLRELAPPEETMDGVDDIARKRAERLARAADSQRT